MNKKYIILLATLLLAVVVGIATVATVNQSKAKEYFPESGYILGSNDEKKVSFTKETEFNASQLGTVTFKNIEGDTAVLEAGSFVHMEDGSMMALDDGILLDFADLSSNFINNYYITRELVITGTGSGYTAETNSGALTFGEHLWKLSDNRYMICSNTLKVHFSDDDIREVNNFVEISVTEDGIVQILTEDNVWMTISDQCYIETEKGVRINPLTHVIDDGKYQITTSKLVVSADDSIVLTEDETRRQIVPELNIDAIDGKDGEDGTIGEDGTSGEDGTMGEDGAAGAAGAAGASGAAGADGATGANGAAGSSGVNGANGIKGTDATHESSINTALPTMTITEWKVTPTSLQAKIGVGGGVETLQVSGNGSDEYCGWITITNVATGEVVYGFQTDELYSTDSIAETDDEISNFKNAVDVNFTTFDYQGKNIDVLTPDTEYKLSVNAYYVVNDVIYCREFISRTFYTDSTGLQITCQSTTTTSANVNVHSTANGTADIYILTEEENKNFSLGSTGFTAKTVNLTEGETVPVTFEGLDPNTKYIVRAVVTADGNKILTNQEEEVRTLKNIPTWDITKKPTAYYNRVNGMFEVFRPTITDPHDGVTHYVYTAYDKDGNVVASKTIDPDEGEPVTFYLDTNEWYGFGVEMHFNDNEKTTIYDLGMSEYILSEGTSLPKLTWTDTLTQEYDGIQGKIRIALDGTSKIEIGEKQPLTLEVYADQVLDQTIQLKPNASNKGDKTTDYYNVNYDPTAENTNYVDINVDFINLLENTNYTFTVSGYVDLGDDNGYVNRTLGYVSTYTYKTNHIRASFVQETSTSAFKVNLKMAAEVSTDKDSSDTAYVQDQLSNGSVSIQLYQGTSNAKTLLTTLNYSAGSPEIADLYNGTGVTLTEDSFGYPNLDSKSDYTLIVSEVVDDTYNMKLGYVNTFNDISGGTKVVTATATPPNLLTEPSGGVEAVPIYNIEATDYGAKYKEDMSDETIIGYRVKSTYDNSQRLAREITYYAYEYSEFYNALSTGRDPLINGGTDEDAEVLATFTLETPNTSDSLPEIAVFFADVEFSSAPTEGITTSKNAYIYQIGENEATYTRGYRYIFAYTTKYAINTSDANTTFLDYPKDHDDYDDFKTEVGCGTEMGTAIGKGVAYILNSGMVEAPKTAPEFATYVYATNASSATDGSVTLHYTYSDGDNAIIATGDDDKKTQIKFKNVDTGLDEMESIGKNPVNGAPGWYSVDIQYRLDTIDATEVLAPEVTTSDYMIEYADILKALGGISYIEEPFVLAYIPVEGSYGRTWGDTANEDKLKVTMSLDNIDKNYIEFKLDNVINGDTKSLETLVDRTYAMKLDFTVNGGIETFYVPITTKKSATYTKYSAIFSTAQLSKHLDKEFAVTASLIYDDGRQGWKVLEEGSYGLQRINTQSDFGYDAYYTSNIGTGGLTMSSSMNGGLLKSNYSAVDLLKAIRDTSFIANDDEDSTRTLVPVHFEALNNNSGNHKYLSTQHFGVNDASKDGVDYITDTYIVPKGATSYPLKFTTGDNSALVDSVTGQVKNITPTVGSLSQETGAAQTTIYSFHVAGADQIDDTSGKKEVTLYVYESEDMTNLVGVGYPVTLDGNGNFQYKPADLEANTESTAIALPKNVAGELEPLKRDTVYYLVFQATIDGDETILLDTDTAEHAIYPFETIDGVRVTSDESRIIYNNSSYTGKSLELKYDLNTYQGVKVAFDIFTEDDVVKQKDDTYDLKENVTPLLGHDELVKSGILKEKTLERVNEIAFNLEPQPAREKLVPGATYYLRVYASIGSDGSVSDTKVLPFKINPIGQVSAIITSDKVTKDSITYYVSIVDDQYSLMSSATGKTHYVVRFTDNNGKRILTKQDKEIYTTDIPKQKIVLENDELIVGEINASTTYHMYVYGVVDATHNGRSYPIETTEVNGKWTLKTDSVQELSYFEGTNESWSGLTKLVNSFWQDGENTNENDQNMDIVEDQFAIGHRIQQTTDNSNLSINTELAAIKLNTSYKMELTLSDSYGVVTESEYVGGDKVQAFNKIEYSITGYTNSEKAVNIYGIAKESDPLFVEETNAFGFNVFTYEIPEAVESGLYTVTIKLYKNVNDPAAAVTISRTVN